mmetsp:Transcript_10757/g.17686  ORF Transcript_10757/g.17686 Transcript_10757/m.17686 type:complete len:127 (+) Transcript_10757:2675-3055(+)
MASFRGSVCTAILARLGGGGASFCKHDGGGIGGLRAPECPTLDGKRQLSPRLVLTVELEYCLGLAIQTGKHTEVRPVPGTTALPIFLGLNWTTLDVVGVPVTAGVPVRGDAALNLADWRTGDAVRC